MNNLSYKPNVKFKCVRDLLHSAPVLIIGMICIYYLKTLPCAGIVTFRKFGEVLVNI